jgi:glycosyltransferase involved in cell wall biosynthesis
LVLLVAFNLEQVLSPSPGGVGRYAARLAAALAGLGVELAPVVARHSEDEARVAWEEAGLAGTVPPPLRLLLPRPLLYDSWHLLGWPPIGGNADLVHAPSLAVPPKGGQPLVVSIHDAAPWVWPETFGWRGKWFHATGARAAAKRADLVLTGTHAAAEELEEHLHLPPSLVEVVPYGVGPPVPPDPTALRRFGLTGQCYVLWVGSLEPRKGVSTLVEAVGKLSSRRQSARLEGPSPAPRERPPAPGHALEAREERTPAPGEGQPALQLVLAGYAGWKAAPPAAPFVRRLGRLADAELQALYAGAAAFAFPSLHEGFGLPVLEAMAAGAPVVASDIPALREVAGDAALLVPAGDAGKWAEAIEAVVCLDQPQRAAVVERGRARAAQFTWRATAERTLELYRRLV